MKSRFLALFALAAAALLSGCATLAPVAAPPGAPAPVAAAPAPEPPAQCRADDARFAVGQTATPQLEAAARVRSGAQSVRTLKPGQAVTMEFNGGRLNVVVDARGRVSAVRCG